MKNQPSISIIIPTLNEEKNVESLLPFLSRCCPNEVVEIIIADGGSTDQTIAVAQKYGATVLNIGQAGRAKQMNLGAQQAKGNVLYFIHADTRPPATFAKDITKAMEENYPIGSYRSKFDSSSFMLKINAWFTRFDLPWARGGDQSIFITKAVFKEFGGYHEDWIIMEEYDLMERIKTKYPFKIFPKATLISARKYENRSWLKVQWANFWAFRLYKQGASQDEIYQTYQRLLS